MVPSVVSSSPWPLPLLLTVITASCSLVWVIRSPWWRRASADSLEDGEEDNTSAYKSKKCACGTRYYPSVEGEEERHFLSRTHQRAMRAFRTRFIVCDEIQEYRQCAREMVGPDDVCLEVGCHNGPTSAYILRNSPKVLVALDQKRDLIQAAKKNLVEKTGGRRTGRLLNSQDFRQILKGRRADQNGERADELSSCGSEKIQEEVAEDEYGGFEAELCEVNSGKSALSFVSGDAFDIRAISAGVYLASGSKGTLPEDSQQLMNLSSLPRFTKIFVDINGSRCLSVVFKLVELYAKVLKPDLIIIKNQPLRRFLLTSSLWVDSPEYEHMIETRDAYPPNERRRERREEERQRRRELLETPRKEEDSDPVSMGG